MDRLYLEGVSATLPDIDSQYKIKTSSLELNQSRGVFGDFNNLEKLGIDALTVTNLKYSLYRESKTDKISNLKVFNNLKSLTLKNFNFMDLNDVENLTGLTKLVCENVCISDISKLSNLVNLTEIDLSDNEITDLSPLINLKNLKTLDLTNNSLDDSTIVLENEKKYTNLDIVAELNTNNKGKLAKIYLEQNPGIISFSKISGLSWTEKKGF